MSRLDFPLATALATVSWRGVSGSGDARGRACVSWPSSVSQRSRKGRAPRLANRDRAALSSRSADLRWPEWRRNRPYSSRVWASS